jgi:hypothetical protein
MKSAEIWRLKTWKLKRFRSLKEGLDILAGLQSFWGREWPIIAINVRLSYPIPPLDAKRMYIEWY